MEDISCTAKGAGEGDSGAGADAAIILAESSAAKDADIYTGDGDGGSASAASLPTTSCSEFHSARIASMLSSRSKFKTELEYRTAHSREHWSELSHHEGASSSEESGSGCGDESEYWTAHCTEHWSELSHHQGASSSEESRSGCGDKSEYRTAHCTEHWSELSHHEGASRESGTGSADESFVDHRQYFEELQRDAVWGGFCNQISDVVLGREVGRGAQGVIYEAQVTFAVETIEITTLIKMGRDFVVKVMKSGYALEDLQRQWPRGLAVVKDLNLERWMFCLYGALVKDHATGGHQFGFVMPRLWGDLRTLIDLRMERNNAEGPPFPTEQARRFMFWIAFELQHLHGLGIIHRDLKAANVLLSSAHAVFSDDLGPLLLRPHVADWECSVGVVGTGFWRAPEILRQLKDRTPSSEMVFTEEMDVYSFAMTCYEIVTGKVPFEGHPFHETRDAILDGARPELPHDMDPFIKDIITSCWHSNPSARPSFVRITDMLIVKLESM